MLNAAVLWDIAPWSSYVSRRSGGTYRLHLHGRKSLEQEIGVQQVARHYRGKKREAQTFASVPGHHGEISAHGPRHPKQKQPSICPLCPVRCYCNTTVVRIRAEGLWDESGNCVEIKIKAKENGSDLWILEYYSPNTIIITKSRRRYNGQVESIVHIRYSHKILAGNRKEDNI
jgi:hypothetical protein